MFFPSLNFTDSQKPILKYSIWFIYISRYPGTPLSLACMILLSFLINPIKGRFIFSVHFSHSVVSDSLRPHESQHARPSRPSPTPWVHPNPCPLSWWCHPTISSSVVSFSSWPQSLPASGSFPVSQLLARGGQSIGVSASASVLPMNTQNWSPLGWTGWISLQSKGLSRVFSQCFRLKIVSLEI